MESKMILTLRELSTDNEDAIFYNLNDNFELRIYSNTGIVLFNRDSRKIEKLNDNQQIAIMLCDTTVDVNIPAITSEIKKELDIFEDKGIIAKTFYKSRVKSLQPRVINNRFIESVFWEITGLCNFRCKHCFLSAPGYKSFDLNTDECKKIIDEIAECGIVRIDLTGGEPLIRKDFRELCEYITSKEISIGRIGTNGFFVNDELLDFFESLKQKPIFSISFDGVGQHDWLRGVNGSEKIVLECHKLLSKRGFYSTSGFSLHKNNIYLIRDTINTLASYGCKSVTVNRVFELGEVTKGNQSIELSPKEYAEACFEYLPQYFEDGRPISIDFKPLFAYQKDSGFWCNSINRNCQNPQNCYTCATTRTMASISADGRLVPCYMMMGQEIKDKFPKILEKGLSNIINNSVYNECVNTSVSDYLEKNEDCAKCEHRLKCAAGCRAFAMLYNPNDYLSKDVITCQYVKNNYHKSILDIVRKYAPDLEFQN